MTSRGFFFFTFGPTDVSTTIRYYSPSKHDGNCRGPVGTRFKGGLELWVDVIHLCFRSTTQNTRNRLNWPQPLRPPRDRPSILLPNYTKPKQRKSTETESPLSNFGPCKEKHLLHCVITCRVILLPLSLGITRFNLVCNSLRELVDKTFFCPTYFSLVCLLTSRRRGCLTNYFTSRCPNNILLKVALGLYVVLPQSSIWVSMLVSYDPSRLVNTDVFLPLPGVWRANPILKESSTQTPTCQPFNFWIVVY